MGYLWYICIPFDESIVPRSLQVRHLLVYNFVSLTYMGHTNASWVTDMSNSVPGKGYREFSPSVL
ncbi:hypothetical protein BABINDRAFT_163447 [Babjeviella inositovora NRRL Y-12698]|uniref:Uncharacterized protein n=1 Tax=Babjeviella inositovora NRRL Y-12698 TaxID=984486 RepID=A0A1E3QJU7_9ASCO|nr:uncharacterized protein BABINDRAFT_163447 [Babjeviella inositovora NRRL Y-12698]ODQ77744.1 hypothetical protein BABINDRAFT_163447 [Babjeviella inositovora NRRL Y-12698]